jgi:hypothetical protein
MTGIELLAAQAISGIAVPVFQTLWGGGGKVLGMFGRTLDEKTKQLIFNASQQYAQNYKERHGILKVLGMREFVDLESIYTSVQFLDEADIRSFASIEKLEEAYREAKIRRFENKECPKQEGIKVANDKQYLMVLGGPGAGKSTFLRKMGLEALKDKKGEFKHGCIPVFIELKLFNSGDINIEQIITEEFRICGFPIPDKFTAKALEQGKLLILLDGLDEVPTNNLNQAITEIQNFVDRYDKNRFIASCRTAAYRSGFRRFSDVAMADFDDTQIQQFIQNWFKSDSDKQAKIGEKCWELLQKPENQAAKELAHTPLLLTFLCLVYDRSQNFPDNRSVLYRKALRILLEEWASEKRILQDEIYQGLHTELEEILLSEIAYTGFEADRLFFPKREIVQQIKTFLAGNLNAPQHLDGEKVLNAIVVQQGILVERAEDVFSFSHLTLQEYLTAQYIDDNRLINQLVSQHLKDERWKEVFLLVAGLMRGGADELLLLMEKEAQNYIISPKLKDLLRWAEQATNGSPADIKPVAKRAIAYAKAYAIVYAKANAKANAKVNAKVYAIAYANAIANANPNANAYAIYAIAYEIASTNAKPNAYAINEAIKLAEELKQMQIFHALNLTTLIARLKALKAQIPDDNEPFEVRRKFVERILETWLNALNLSPEIINLSKEETIAIKKYLYANNLILQCKQAAVRVSPKTWEGIEERMLLPPNT